MKIPPWTALVLTFLPVLAIPPSDFGFPSSSNQLSVIYQSNGSQPVQPGILFGINVPAMMPQFAVSNTTDTAYSGDYMLFMLDPDASYPQAPQNRWIIHYWQMGVRKSGTTLQNTTAPKVSYRRPAPPTNSSAHRYIQYLFEQPANFQLPAIYSGYNQTNSSKFPFERFVADAGLAAPVAANYFYCSNQSVVPGTFVAPPGGLYPGGNGAMVTQGLSGSATSTSMASATSAGNPATYTGSAGATVPKLAILTMALAGATAWSLL